MSVTRLDKNLFRRHGSQIDIKRFSLIRGHFSFDKHIRHLVSSKMALSSVLQIIQLIYSLLGQATVPDTFKQKFPFCFCKCIHYLPHALILYSTYLADVHILTFFNFHNTTDVVVGITFVSITNMLILITVVRSILSHHKWTEIHSSFIIIENDLKTLMHRLFNTSKFIKIYCAQVMFILLTFVTCTSLKFILPFPALTWQTELSYTYYRIYKYTVTFHTLFYVNLLNAFFDCMQESLFDSEYNNDNHQIEIVIGHRNIMYYFVQCRNLHNKLHTSTYYVTEYFGWTLVFLIMQNLLDFAYNCSWIYFYMDQMQHVYIIRMYQ